MIVIYGTRCVGKVDQRDGQYALTRFAHVYWIPLVPSSSVWVTTEGRGHEMKMSGKSVLAGYLRTWSFVLAIIGLITGGFGGFALAIVALAAGASTLLWHSVRGERSQRMSDLNMLAFGTRCEPKQMTEPLAAALEGPAKQRWARVANGQSPNDVARFGTDDVDRAAAAYAVLRLSARSLPRAQAAEAEADAARIAIGLHEKLQLTEGGPYRNAPVIETPVSTQTSK